MPHVHLILPNGTVMSASLPLNSQLERQVRAGTLKLGEPVPPEAGLDGEGGAERVSAPPPAETPVVEEKPTVDPMSVSPPRGNASLEEWIEFAVSQGMDREEALSLKRDEIRARFALGDNTDSQDGE